jgi:hypothetical protein
MGIADVFRDDIEARRWFDIIGPRSRPDPVAKDAGARWTGEASDAELREIARIDRRSELRRKGLAEDAAQRRKIMMRCIRRLRRKEGKE